MALSPVTLLAVLLLVVLFFGGGGLYYRPNVGSWAFTPLALILILLTLLVLTGRVRF